MKKVLPIALILLILLSATCFAAYEPDSTRWFLINSEDTKTEYLDVKTIDYSTDLNSVNFWICYVNMEEDNHTLVNLKIDRTDKTITLIHSTEYSNSTRKILHSVDIPTYQQSPSKIIPNTRGEYYYELLFITLPKLALEEYEKENQK